MGFRLEIEEGKSDILRKLRLSPYEVFGKPYGGYLFFLIGEADNEILEWLSKNAAILDSLTGRDIAFVVFARRINVKLKTYSPNKSRPPKVTTVDMGDVIRDPSLERLVKRKCGWVLDGDEINAVTYAVDEVAKKFEVLTDLPCVLVLDAIPRQNFEIYHLNTSNTHDFIQLLRQVINSLLELPEYSILMSKIRHVIRLRSTEIGIDENIKKMEYDLEQLNSDEYIIPIQKIMQEFRSALLAGNTRKFKALTKRHALKLFMENNALQQAFDEAQAKRNLLLQYSSTIQRMSLYEKKYQWSLADEYLSNYLNVYEKHVRSLLLEAPEITDTPSLQQCTELVEKLRNQQDKLINTILGFLPSDEYITQRAESLITKRADELKNKIRDGVEQKQNIEADILINVKQLYQLDNASFMQIFAQQSKTENRRISVRQIRDKVTAYAGSWLKPEIIMEMLKPIV